MFDKYRRKSGIGAHSGPPSLHQESRPPRHNASQSLEEPLVRNFSMNASEAQTESEQDLTSNKALHPVCVTNDDLKSKTPRVSTIFQDFSIRNESKLPPSPNQTTQPVFKPWAPDIALLLTAACLLAAIFATTLSQDGKPQRDWTLPITLNAIDNVLSTLFRACIAAVAAESDAHGGRPMIDLQHFDSGSRDLLGALRLGGVVKWKSPATVMAVFVVVASFAVGPCVQQAIGTIERVVVDPGEVASIPAAQGVDLDSSFFEAIYRDDEDGKKATERIMRPGMRISLQTAMQSPRGVESSVAPVCPTGNCTFMGLESDAPVLELGEITHASTGLCSFCTDVTPFISVAENNSSIALPNGMNFSLGRTATGMAFGSGDLSWANSVMSERAISLAKQGLSNITVLTTQSPIADRYGAPFVHTRMALSCSLYLCLRSYSGVVQKTQLREKLVSEVPMYHDPMYDGVEHQWVKNGSYLASRTPCVINGRNYTAEAEAGSLNITTFWAPDAAECIYSVAPAFADGLSSFLNEAFNETCIFSAFQDGNLWCKNNFWLSELWYRGNATVELVSGHFADIATAVTNQLRRGLGRQEGSMAEVEGQALQYVVFVVIDKGWLAFPAVLLGLEAVLLGVMIARSWRLRDEEAVWKSSILPLIFYRSQFAGSGEVVSSERRLMTVKEMETNARNICVKFSRVRTGDEMSLHRIANAK
ncbi:short-chain dehydrogenase [Colletotrichum asianum]